MRRSMIGTCLLLVLLGIGGVWVIPTIEAENPVNDQPNINYREEMASLVRNLSGYSKNKSRGFQLVGNNGLGLCEPGALQQASLDSFVNSLDGMLVESLLYGWDMKDDVSTPAGVLQEAKAPLDFLQAKGRSVFTIDYCRNPVNVDTSYRMSAQQGRVGFAANSRNLDTIPHYPYHIYRENTNTIRTLRQAKNFLILLNPHFFADKETYLKALEQTNYDVLILDLYFNEDQLTAQDLSRLKVKANGASRLVLAYMSVGEAEDYRPYWPKTADNQLPTWVGEKNAQWQGNYKVQYWNDEWKNILFGREDAYLDRIIEAGFSGAFLDVLDAYQYFTE